MPAFGARRVVSIFACLAAVTALAPLTSATAAEPVGKWIPLFDGKSLDGWKVKIKGHPLGANPGNTFRVENGVLKVSYDKYEKFDRTFGHLFYKRPFSHYVLRAEYRFTGKQVPGGPSWAFRNSGLMLHCQPPETMGRDQDFPVSIEVQLLGGDGKKQRPTANLCTPGTHVVIGGKLITRHITRSTSATYHGDQWVQVEVEVRGDEVIRHKVNGQNVLEYHKPQLDPGDKDAKKQIKNGRLALRSGYISLQSESHPVEFRRVELMKLRD